MSTNKVWNPEGLEETEGYRFPTIEEHANGLPENTEILDSFEGWEIRNEKRMGTSGCLLNMYRIPVYADEDAANTIVKNPAMLVDALKNTAEL